MTRLTHQQISQRLAEYCEELLFQNTAFMAVLTAKGDIALIRRYKELVTDPQLKAEIHAKFAPLFAGISATTQDMDAGELASKIPPIPELPNQGQ